MRNRVARWLYAAAFFAILSCPVLARAGSPSVGVTAAIMAGTHDETSGRATLPLLPVPLINVRIPLNRFEIDAEGVPPIGPVPYSSSIRDVWRATKLSYGYAALRYRFNDVFSVGIGETLYNQSTIYTETHVYDGFFRTPNGTYPVTTTSSQSEVDSSRVPGARYDVETRLPITTRSSLVARFAVTPAMHAIVFADDAFQTHSQTTAPITLRPFSSTRSFGAPETASEVDASLALARHLGATTLTFGIRYLNYVARFNWSGRLADRNTLVLPFIGFERALGR
jgi:hypothetical protein